MTADTYLPQFFKVAAVKGLLKKPAMDVAVLPNCRPIFPFYPIVIRKWVKIIDFLHSNGLSEVFWPSLRMHHSIETALVKGTDDILTGSQEGLILYLLDLGAASCFKD